MSKRKAESLSADSSAVETKKTKYEKNAQVSKPQLMDDSDSDDGGVKLDQSGFTINEEYKNRFEHNKKRAELHRLEEKFNPSKPAHGVYGDKYDEDSEDSDASDEDDVGGLATERLDAEIAATLQAIRTKDPRVYDEKVTFYSPMEDVTEAQPNGESKSKPMHLRDYHRENILKGYTGAEEEKEETVPKSYAQEQEDLRRTTAKEMHAAADNLPVSSDDEDGGFLVPKSRVIPNQGMHPSRAAQVKVDVATADKDPDLFLSNFMTARAWVPSDATHFQPLESDDEEEDDRAENFETAYNLRFEDPEGSNEMLKSYARDIVAAKSVRREEPNNRKKLRDALRERKEAEKAERNEERAQLRRLKIDEMEQKLQKIKHAAGIKGKALSQEEWTLFLDEGYDDEDWDSKFSKHFGDEYYAEQSDQSEDDEEEAGSSKKKKKVKKPKFDDDIDINDIVPDFVDKEEKPMFTLSDDEEAEAEAEDLEEDSNGEIDLSAKKKSSKDRQKEKAAKKKASRIERKKIEDLVDNRLELDLPFKSKQQSRFHYRETSPTTFGLTVRDILMAPDTALNQFAGLKKLASFRDTDNKRKDKRYLGKKARLREWRKETFGNEDGPEIIIGGNAGGEVNDVNTAENGVNIVEGKKKKKRCRKNKTKSEA